MIVFLAILCLPKEYGVSWVPKTLLTGRLKDDTLDGEDGPREFLVDEKSSNKP